MFCPKCGAEYAEGINICKDCNENLLASKTATEITEKKYGSPRNRFFSSSVDNLIIGLPLMIIIFSLRMPQYILSAEADSAAQGARALTVSVTYLLLANIIALAYGTLLIGKYGATLGQKLFKLKVVTEDEKALNYKQSFLRTLVFLIYSIPYIGAVVYLASGITLIVDKKRQTFHDKACRTIVVNIK